MLGAPTILLSSPSPSEALACLPGRHMGSAGQALAAKAPCKHERRWLDTPCAVLGFLGSGCVFWGTLDPSGHPSLQPWVCPLEGTLWGDGKARPNCLL